MTKTPKPHSPHGLARYEDFAHLLPVPMTRKKVIELSQQGRFPPFVRNGDVYRSPPLWRREAVVRHLREVYGELIPERVAGIERAFTGVVFDSKSTLVATPMPSQKRTKKRKEK